LNPAQVRAKEAEQAEKVEARRLELMDDDNHDKMLRAMFEYDERTEHKGIIPARERIKQYKTKNIRRNLPSALPKGTGKSRMQGVQSQADLTAPTAKDFAGARPTTAGVTSAFGQSEALTAATLGLAGSTQAESQAALQLARNISASRFSRFEENEKTVEKQPYKVFFTSNEPTSYHRENRFEGRSNY
jgi:hypothetical protein